jgi:cysteine-rich repeat protein
MPATRVAVFGLCLVVLASWDRAAAVCPPNGAGGPSLVVFDALGEGDLDLGWTGSFFNFPTIGNMRLQACLSQCDTSVDPTCDVAGPTGPGTANGVMLGPPLPLAAVGVGLCVVNRFASIGQAGFTGTLDLSSGATTVDIPLVSEVYLTDRVRVCPRCEADRCDDGPNKGRPCTVHGSVRVQHSFALNPVFHLSQDCPPDPAQLVRSSSIRLTPSTGTATTPGTGGSTPCTQDVAIGIPPQDDNCGGASCSLTGNCVGNACVSMVPHPADGTLICIDEKGGLSQACCNGNPVVPCHATFSGGPGIVRQGKAVGATTPSPWGDAQYPKTASGVVLASTFCVPPTGTGVVDITMGLPGPGALIVPLDATWGMSECGNGVVEFDEQCDDANTSDDDCCTGICRFQPSGTPCGVDAPACGTGACDAAGACVHAPGAGTECRAPEDACDAGDVCDGVAAECPSIGRGQLCQVTAPASVDERESIPVTCEVIERDDVVVRGASRCAAVGFAAHATSGSALTPAAAVPELDPLGPQVTARVKKKLKRVAGQPIRRRTFSLKLNRTGRRLLKQRGFLDVILSVTLHHGQVSRTEFRPVTVTKSDASAALVP